MPQAISNRDVSGAAAAIDDAVSSPRREDVALLFTEVRAPLHRYLLSLSLAAAEAEDVAQEAFLRLCEQFSAGVCFVGPLGIGMPLAQGASPNLRAWIFRVAHNLALDQLRRRLRWNGRAHGTGDADEVAAQMRDERLSPEQNALMQQRFERLQLAIRRLPENQQFCLHLRAEGLRYREIAEVLGVGTSTVADWVAAALERLGKELK